ncbi:hypothetical protein ACFYMX_04925 [Streptomyces griseofuscus]|uniref:hypothetical protein n=1 Tax=Streptomyces TaxID=1883 RepID=UPI0033D0FFBE
MAVAHSVPRPSYAASRPRSVFKDLASKFQQFSNEDELLTVLKEKSPKLYEKAVELGTPFCRTGNRSGVTATWWATVGP